LKLKKKVG